MELGDLGQKLIQAFGWQGKHGDRLRLHGIVDDAIKQHGVGQQAFDRIKTAIKDDPVLLLEMLTELRFLDALIWRFMQARTAVLRAQGATYIRFPRKRDGGGQLTSDTHVESAPTTRQNGGHDAADGRAGQNSSDTHSPITRPASGQNPAEKAGGGGHDDDDAQRTGTPAESTRGPAAPGAGGQQAADSHDHSAPGSHPDTPQLRTGDAMRAAARPKRTGAGTNIGAAMRNCALDRIRINGKPLRYAKPEEALQQAELWHIEARTVEAICTGLAPDQPVGEQLSDEEANRLADRASKTTA